MEACGGSHYWSREFAAQGYMAKQVPAQHVAPFRGKGHKNDFRDAQAVLEAGRRPGMKYVTPKSVTQQERQILHRIRTRINKERVALANETRGFLAEFGVILRKGHKALDDYINYEAGKDSRITDAFRERLFQLGAEIRSKKDLLVRIDKEIHQDVRSSPEGKSLLKMRGVGDLIASALLCISGDIKQFKNGRHFAAFLGLVPRQNSTGGKAQLLGLTKSGNAYLRSLLIVGAQSVINNCEGKTDNYSLWVQKLLRTKERNLVAVAIANKNARIAWQILAKGAQFDPNLACQAQ